MLPPLAEQIRALPLIEGPKDRWRYTKGSEMRELAATLAAEHDKEVLGLLARIEELERERDEANREAWNARLERQRLKEAIATPDKLFASQIECAMVEPLRQAQQSNAQLQQQLDAMERLYRDERAGAESRWRLHCQAMGCGPIVVDQEVAKVRQQTETRIQQAKEQKP